MMMESLESRQLLSTTYPVNYTFTSPKLTATAVGSITCTTGTLTLTGTLSGTFNGTTFSYTGTTTLPK